MPGAKRRQMVTGNAGDGIGRPNAKSNAGSSWGEKDKMESDEHLKVPKESDTWNTGKSNESPWDNTDALQDSWVNSISPGAKEQEQKNSRNGSDLPIISMTTAT